VFGLARRSLRLKTTLNCMRLVQLLDHGRDKVFEGGDGVGATTGVDGRGLDDCAARSDEPMKTLALW
jgi:hypothetical protein